MKPAVGSLLLLLSAGQVVDGRSEDDRWEKAAKSYEENVRIASRYPVDDFKRAIDAGDAKTLKRLLAQGVPASCPLPWSKDSWEGYPPPTDYPIHLAAASGHLEIARLLLDHGASPKAHGGEGNFTPLHAANDVEISKLLISRGAEVNARDDFGRQPIHNAADNLAMVKLLIAHGADPLAKGHHEEQPIHAAARSGTAVDVAFFLGLKAKVDAKVHDKEGHDSWNGWQPLHFTASREDMDEALEVAELLIRNGADVNAVTADGETSLHLSKNATMTRFLLDQGAKIQVMSTSISRMLPIHRFALHGDAESIRLLLDRGADPDVLTGDPIPETPLDIAVFFNKRGDTANLLLKRGAKATRRTLAAAERSRNDSMIRLIRARLDSSPKRPPHRQ